MAITTDDAGSVAAATIFREARLLDHGEWDDWVAMYREDAVYWVPAWLDEHETTNDPTTQVSLLYHDARRGLEERVARIESRKSITALPLPRRMPTNLARNRRSSSLSNWPAAMTVSTRSFPLTTRFTRNIAPRSSNRSTRSAS